MKKYVIVKSVNETDRIAKFHAESGNRYIGKYHGSFCAIVDEYDTLQAANKELADIAMTDADSDCNISPNFHSWALFCASNPNRAGSDKRTHYRWYSDGDCTRYEVNDTESNDSEIERAIYDAYHDEETMKITNNGIDLLTGDDKSIGMIWANLTGVNLQGKDLDDYLAWAKTQGLQSGTIAMITDNGKTIKTATIIK